MKFETRYLDVRLVLLMDIIITVAVSIVVALIAYMLNVPVAKSREFMLLWDVSSGVFSTLMFLLLKTHRIIIRRFTFRDTANFIAVSLGKVVLMGILIAAVMKFDASIAVMLAADFFFSTMMFCFVRLLMIYVYERYKGNMRSIQRCTRVLAYGMSDKTESLLVRLRNSHHYNIVGVLSTDRSARGTKFLDTKVYTVESEAEFNELAAVLSLGGVIFSRDVDAKNENGRIVSYCINSGLKVFITPQIDETSTYDGGSLHVRPVKIEDLLGRDEIKISLDSIRSSLEGKTIMVTGGAGSIGSELCRQLASFNIGKLLIFDNAESPVHEIRLELEDKYPGLEFVPIIGDVRLEARLDFAFRTYHPQVVFHAAAYKHVPLMEENPCEAVLVNVCGSRNVAEKCVEYGVEKMVMISTDKAVNPTNVMGCSKRLAEIYVQSLGLAIESGKVKGSTKFVTTRFGNVLGSNGSVIPRFRAQLENGGPITVTHPDITRFFMTIPEACRLVMEAAILPTENKICVFDMGDPVKIDSLARKMIELAGLVPDEDIKIVYTGLRSGEKLYEEVLSNVENTIPTGHKRIRIAKVRSYEYAEAVKVVGELEKLSRAVDIPETVKLMKKTVPEYKSTNSRFEIYDK